MQIAAGLAIPHRKMVLLLDCCHAGGLDNIKAPGLTLATNGTFSTGRRWH
jgi:hypothetical protein